MQKLCILWEVPQNYKNMVHENNYIKTDEYRIIDMK